MKSYGFSMIGVFVIEKLATLPTWISSDEGRYVYVEDTNISYFGTDSKWQILSDVHAAENLSEDIYYPAISGSIVDTGSVQTLTNKNIDGTTSASFKINSSGSEADIQTTKLTADRDFNFPDIDTMIAGSAIISINSIEIIVY